MKFYTHVHVRGDNINVRGYKNGKRFVHKVEYNPTLYIPSRQETEFRTLEGDFVSPIQMGSIREAATFSQKYNDVANFKVYGSTKWA